MNNSGTNPIFGSGSPQNPLVQRTDNRPQKENKNKDFKKVLEGENEEAEIAEEEKALVRKARDRSIFDIPKKQAPMTPMQATLPLQNPLEAQTDLSTLAALKQQKHSLSDDASDYAQPQGDLSYVNPQLASQQPVTSIPRFDIEANTGGESSVKAGSVQQIVDQIVDNIYTLKTSGQTETVMTLKNPPVLAGAEVVLSGIDHARGEFNIAIHNLTQAAQSFLEQNNLRLGLKQALEEKGYTVHMVIATTEPFQRTIAVENTEMSGKGRREEQEESPQDERNQGRRNRG